MFGCSGSLLVCGLSLVVPSGGYSPVGGPWTSPCGGFSCCGAQALSAQASVVAAQGLSNCGARASCSLACEIFLDQESNPRPLHCQGDS